jgi:hypothetical protein
MAPLRLMGSICALCLALGCGSSDDTGKKPGDIDPDRGGKTDNPAEDDPTDFSNRDTKGAEFGTDCEASAPMAVQRGEGLWMPQIAASGDRYGVVFLEVQHSKEFSTQVAHLGFAAIDGKGQLIVSPTRLTDEPTAQAHPDQPAIVGAGDEFVVAWGDHRGAKDLDDVHRRTAIYVARVDGDGQPRVQGALTDYHGGTFPVLASAVEVDDGSEVAVAWIDGRNVEYDDIYSDYGSSFSGRYDIHFGLIDVEATLAREQRVTTDDSHDDPWAPQLVRADGGYYTAWIKRNAMSWGGDVAFASLDARGEVQGSESRLLTLDGLVTHTPPMVYAGSELGVIHAKEALSGSGGAIYLTRVADDAAPLDEGDEYPTQVVTSQDKPCTPAISHNGEHYAALWQHNCGETGSRLIFALIGDDGMPIDRDGASCAGGSDDCGLLTVDVSTDGTSAFPDMISVDGRFAAVWMNAPLEEISFAQIICRAAQ